MQTRIGIENAEKIKKRLNNFTKEDIEYNEPHFSIKLERLKIDRNEVIRNLIKPDHLAFVGICEPKNKNYQNVYDLYFKLSKNRIFKIPTIFKTKSLYLITIFKIRRKIQNDAIKYYQK